MAQPFSPQQRDAIREKLKESARKYAVSTGVKKTSLDMLTADAGISKSSFYKFYDSKELLFLEIAADWESQIIAAVNESLESSIGMDDKRRAANMVYTAFETIHNLGIIRFLCEDLPELARFIPEEDARTPYLSSAPGIFDMLRRAKIHFSVHHQHQSNRNGFLPRAAPAGHRRMRRAGRVTSRGCLLVRQPLFFPGLKIPMEHLLKGALFYRRLLFTAKIGSASMNSCHPLISSYQTPPSLRNV